VAVECNYDEDILSKAERMPEKVRYRVRHAHMSVAQTCQWLQGLDVTQTREVYLMHLSDACSNEWLFRRMVQAVLPGRVQVIICPKERAV
jgi:hypothetical protein